MHSPTGSSYYHKTASAYDELHLHAGDEHFIALRYLSHLLPALSVRTVLDVGTGTGRAVKYLAERHPGMEIIGIEPEESLRRIAIQEHGLPEHMVRPGNALNIPFPDRSFDVVCEFGVLHHVRTPRVVIDEMLRTARKAIVLSDENRFAHGSMPMRLLKLALWHLKVFPLFYWLKTRGKSFRYSEGDGVAYSYSVFDALPQLSEWADRLIMIPLDRSATNPDYRIRSSSLFQPLLTSFRLMLIAVRDMEVDIQPTESLPVQVTNAAATQCAN
jgi:ubiquinone/menaquinone biosynthesis C-methylase UbiE